MGFIAFAERECKGTTLFQYTQKKCQLLYNYPKNLAISRKTYTFAKNFVTKNFVI